MRLQALILSSGATRSWENSNMTERKASSKFGGFSREHISFHFLSHLTHPGIVYGISSALSWGGDQVLFPPGAANGFIILTPNGQSWDTCLSLMTLTLHPCGTMFKGSELLSTHRLWSWGRQRWPYHGSAVFWRGHTDTISVDLFAFVMPPVLPTSICFLDQTDLLLFSS